MGHVFDICFLIEFFEFVEFHIIFEFNFYEKNKIIKN